MDMTKTHGTNVPQFIPCGQCSDKLSEGELGKFSRKHIRKGPLESRLMCTITRLGGGACLE